MALVTSWPKFGCNRCSSTIKVVVHHRSDGCSCHMMRQNCAGLKIGGPQASLLSPFVRYTARHSRGILTIIFEQISDVIIGWESEVFKKCPKEMLEKPWKCISAKSENRTFDCSLKTEDDVITWSRGLMALVCIRPGRTAPTVDSMKQKIQTLRETFN